MKGALLGGGGSAEVFAWGEDRVVKLFRPAYAHIAPLELERARVVAASGAPCPAVHDVVELLMRFGIGEDRHSRDVEARLALRRALTGSYLARVLELRAAAREDIEATLPIVADAILRQVPAHPHRDALRRLAAAEEGLP